MVQPKMSIFQTNMSLALAKTAVVQATMSMVQTEMYGSG
jgi:hypothetical protein